MPGLTVSGTEAADFRKIVCPITVDKEEADRFCLENSISKSAFFETAFGLGGEALSGVTAENADIYNLYGPTECTNDNTCYRLEKGKKYGEVPIGSLLPNMWGFVTDRFGPLLDALAEHFAVITIENILDHARFIFDKENVGDVVNFYVSVLDYTLPEDMEVYGFFGHSFGGELAYRMGGF